MSVLGVPEEGCPPHPRSQRGLGRRLIIGTLLLTSLTLSACSVLRLAYDQAPTLVQWRLERDLSLDRQQSDLVRGVVHNWFAWHRGAELSRYAQWLDEVATALPGELDAPQTCRWWSDAAQAGERALQSALPGLGQLAVTLRPEQVERLADRQAAQLVQLREEYLSDDAPAQRAERITARMERLYGRLSNEQKSQVASLVSQRSWDDQRWITRREQRVERLVSTLNEIQDTDAQQAGQALQPILGDVLPAPPAGAHADARAGTQRVMPSVGAPGVRAEDPSAILAAASGCQFAAQLHGITDAQQRAAAVRRLSGWADDLRRLAQR